MARKRKTDHASAIAAALDLFWQRGYTGAGTREIEEKTGLTRFTLQTAYGGKEKFFLETLDAYLDNAEAQHFPDPGTTGISELAQWFESIASAEKMPAVEEAGCLAFNAINQFDRSIPEVNQRIERYLAGLEQRFAAILEQAETGGAARLPQPPQDAAKVLMGLLLGLHTLIKARTADQLPQSYAHAAAGLLRSWQAA